jgi:hypothetical protein
MEQEVVVLKRVSKLGKLKSSEQIYHQDKKDYDEQGTPFDTLNISQQGFLGVVNNITPHWNYNEGKWAFAGSYADLVAIAKQIRLTGADGKVIIPTEDSAYSRQDPFWGHKTLWTTEFMRDNVHSFTESNPYSRLFSLILKGREDVEDPTSSIERSKMDTESSGLVLMSNKIENVKKSEKIDEELEAIELFISLSKNFDKLKRIASIIDPPGFNDSYNDPTALKVLIKTSVVDVEDHTVKFGMSPRRFFVKLCKLDNATLDIYSNVSRAIQLGVIRPNTTKGYAINGIPILDGAIRSHKQIIDYYLDADNITKYENLLQLIVDRDGKNSTSRDPKQ